MPQLPLTHLSIRPKDLTRLTSLLRRYLPQGEVWAYGSRVKGTNHEASDLDLVVRNPRDLSRQTTYLGILREDLAESDIPIQVQVMDWANLPVSFREEIQQAYVAILEDELAQEDANPRMPQSLTPHTP